MASKVRTVVLAAPDILNDHLKQISLGDAAGNKSSYLVAKAASAVVISGREPSLWKTRSEVYRNQM